MSRRGVGNSDDEKAPLLNASSRSHVVPDGCINATSYLHPNQKSNNEFTTTTSSSSSSSSSSPCNNSSSSSSSSPSPPQTLTPVSDHCENLDISRQTIQNNGESSEGPENPEQDSDNNNFELVDYSQTRVRLVSVVVLLLYGSAILSMVPLINQYLNHRWTLEAGHSTSHDNTNRSLCRQNSHNSSSATSVDEISARVSTETTYYNYASSVIATVTSLFLGAYADIIGRRKIILISATSTLAHFMIVIFIMRFDLSTNLFYLSSVVVGLGGSIYTMLIGIFTVMADVNVGKTSRVLWLGLQTCVTSVTMSVTNIALGYAIKYLGFYKACVIWTVPSALCLVVAFLFLPETLPKSLRDRKGVSLSPWVNVARVFSIYTSEGTRRTRISLFLLMVMFFFAVVPDLLLFSVDTVFQLHRPLCWDSTLVGYYGALQMGGKKLLATVLLKTMQSLGWLKDEKLAVIGLVFQAGGMVFQAFVQNTLQMFLVPLMCVPGVITVIVIRGLMSCLVGPHNQGALFASIAVVETLSSITTSTSTNRLYTATVEYMPGAVYFMMAFFAIVTFVVFIPFFYFYDDPSEKKRDEKNKEVN